jgi:hypothetical protein
MKSSKFPKCEAYKLDVLANWGYLTLGTRNSEAFVKGIVELGICSRGEAGMKTIKQQNREVLKQWDNDEIVWSIELGGLGPSYEQALTLAESKGAKAERERIYQKILEIANNPRVITNNQGFGIFKTWLKAELMKDG